MSTFLWLLPILASIALVLGACRGETLGRIAKESGRSFAKLVGGMILLGVALEVILLIVPRL